MGKSLTAEAHAKQTLFLWRRFGSVHSQNRIISLSSEVSANILSLYSVFSFTIFYYFQVCLANPHTQSDVVLPSNPDAADIFVVVGIDQSQKDADPKEKGRTQTHQGKNHQNESGKKKFSRLNQLQRKLIMKEC